MSYITSDLGTIAFLMVRGHCITRIDGPLGGKRLFVFDDAAAHDAAEYSRGAHAPARALVQALKDAKALVFRNQIGDYGNGRTRQ